ncbi:MAG: permease [Balneolaceae bacterium]|nr:permease [Balneolaceae bacterium]
MSSPIKLLERLAEFLAYQLLYLEEGARLAEALIYFIPGFIMLSILLTVVVYLMTAITGYVSFEKIRNYLEQHKKSGLGNVMASGFGAITPFCSCSSVPIFIGMMQAKIPLGIALSFLITSPLVNEIAIAVFWVTYGWQFTLIYIASGMILGIVGGMLLEKLGLAESVADWVRELAYQNLRESDKRTSFAERLPAIHSEAFGTVRKLVPYVFLGILIGSLIHGYVPETFFEETIAADNPLAVPVAVILAIPLYIDAVTILPVIDSLVAKGVPMGTAIAFMMGSIGLSLPSAILLKKVMKMKLIVSFFVTIGVGMILSGYFFNAVF